MLKVRTAVINGTFDQDCRRGMAGKAALPPSRVTPHVCDGLESRYQTL